MATKRKLKSKKGKAPNATASTPLAEIGEDEVEEWFLEEEQEETEPEAAPADNVADKYAKSQLRVVRESKDFTLDYLQHALKTPNYIINVAPEYQRRLRWSTKKRSLLIESFLLNIPIPPVFLFERDYNSYEVVDGRQRLDTIGDFLENGFALRGLKYWSELNGKRFKKLPPVIQKGLIRRSIGATVLLAETRRLEDDELDVRTVLFDRLNTGGEKLNAQELRNALYPGPFNQLLIDTARSDNFTSVWGIPKRTPDEEKGVISDSLARNTLYRTMADCELVLRVIAIKEAIVDERRGSLRRLLDASMKRHKEDSAASLDALREAFDETLTTMIELFDERPFRLPVNGRLSRALYDSLMVAYLTSAPKNTLQAKSKIQRAVSKALTTESQYEILVGRGNTIDAIRKRVKLARSILFGAA